MAYFTRLLQGIIWVRSLINREIDVKFSIISGNTLGPVVYQELLAYHYFKIRGFYP